MHATSASTASSSAAPVTSPTPTVQCTTPPPAALDPASRSKMSVVRPAFVSAGHAGGMYQATVRSNDIAARSRAQVGAIWIAELSQANGSEPGPVLAMERRQTSDPTQSAWCFVVADADGTVLRAGVLADCAGCHQAASSSGVFSSSE